MGIRKQLIEFVKPAAEFFPSVMMTYRYIRDNRQIQDPKKTPLGFKLVGSRLMEQGTFEPEETAIINQFLQQVDVFINVGANIGYYCCLALQRGKYTIAFEPIESNLRYLYKNIKANHWENNIEIFPIALSHKTGIIEIFGNGTGASLIKGWSGTPENYVRTVPTSTLDNVLGKRLYGKKCFILVDIEGAEKFMLEGATSCLDAEPKPIWMVEISVSDHQPKPQTINPNLLSTFHFFWDKGYEAWTADKQLRPVHPGEVESIARMGKNTLGTHNFLFIEKGRTKIDPHLI